MRDSLPLPDEDEEYQMYLDSCEQLLDRGYYKYEISNFAHKGYESKHNMKYWQGDSYIGFGVSAHSYFEGERYARSRDMKGYLDGIDITSERKKISLEEKKTELVMLGMRLSRGIVYEEYEKKVGEDFLSVYRDRLEKYARDGYVVIGERSTAFTDKGFLVSNYILSDILDFRE